jgi:hypothetical protein
MKSDKISSGGDEQKVVRYKLAKTLILLTSETQIGRRESDTLIENNHQGTQYREVSSLKKISHSLIECDRVFNDTKQKIAGR